MARTRPARPRPTRDGILDAAEALFAARGFADPSLRDLMSACGCSTTAFYARFPDKGAVLVALVEDLLDQLRRAALETLPRAPDLERGWVLGLEVLVATLKPRRGLVRVALSEGLAVPEVRARLAAGWSGLTDLLAGLLPGDDAAARASALVGALTFQVTRWAVLEAFDDDALPEALAAVAATLRPPDRSAR